MITPEAQKKGAAANRAKALERDKFVLTRLEAGASYRHIAAWLGISESTARTVILRARRRAGIGPTR